MKWLYKVGLFFSKFIYSFISFTYCFIYLISIHLWSWGVGKYARCCVALSTICSHLSLLEPSFDFLWEKLNPKYLELARGVIFSAIWVRRGTPLCWGAVSVRDTDVCQSRQRSRKLDSRFLRGCWKTNRLKTKKYFICFIYYKLSLFPVLSKRKQSKYLHRKVNLKVKGLG